MRHGQGFEELYRNYESREKDAGILSLRDVKPYSKIPLLYEYAEGEIFNGANEFSTEVKFKGLIIRLSYFLHANSFNLGENKNIPAGFTYFLQFVVHDIVRSSVFKKSYSSEETVEMKNFETKKLDLYSLYGPGDIGYPPLFVASKPGRFRGLFRFGSLNKATGADDFKPAQDHDIARLKTGPWCGGGADPVRYEPLLADTRNADSLILSNLVVLFQEYHNIIFDLLSSETEDHEDAARRARAFVENTYRNIIDNELAPLLFGPERWRQIKAGVKSRASVRLTGETIFAALRFGHSMVRQNYAFNDSHDKVEGNTSASLEQLLSFSGFMPNDNLPVSTNWKIDWRRFFDFDEKTAEGNKPNLNLSKKIGPGIATALMNAPGIAVAAPEEFPQAKVGLAYRTLMKGVFAGLPTAQALIAKLRNDGVKIGELPEKKIRNKLIEYRNGLFYSAHFERIITSDDIEFLSKRTPLFLYTLLEAAEIENGERLGPLASNLVGELLAGALGTSENGGPAISIRPPDTMSSLITFVESNRNLNKGGVYA